MSSQKIETIKKRYQNEWLLITIDKMDESTTIPISGKLIAHSPQRDEIYEEEMRCRGNTLTLYSEDKLPKGYAAAF